MSEAPMRPRPPLACLRRSLPAALWIVAVWPGLATAQIWTGEQLLTSGDWIEMSFSQGPGGPRTYRVEGTSLVWERGPMQACGPTNRQDRCFNDRTFRLPLPAGCVGPFKVSYHYSNEGSPDAPDFDNFADNDFLVGVGSATWALVNLTGDGAVMWIADLKFTDMEDPAFDEISQVIPANFLTPPAGGEVWAEMLFDLSAVETWSLTVTAHSTSHSIPLTISAETSAVPLPDEPLYVFLISGDRSEQYRVHSVELEGCESEASEDRLRR